MALSNSAKWTASIVVMLVIMLIMLLLAEGAVRLRHSMKYGDMPTVEDTFTVDASIGLRVPIAGFSAGPIKINSLGFRGPEIVNPKPEKTIRIAFLGASTTYCAEVSSNEMVWPHLVVEELKQRFPKVEFDYVNGGVPGYSVASSLKNLQKRVAPLQPDVVVVYHGTNDLAYETRRLAEKRGLYEMPKPAERSWLSRNSLLWGLVEKNLAILAAQGGSASDAKLSYEGNEIGAEFSGDLQALLKQASSLSERVAVARFSHQLRDDHPPEAKATASSSALYYMPFLTADGLLTGYHRINDLIDDAASKTGSLLIAGENSIPGDSEHFNDSVHFKDAGSQKMAERVANALAEDPEIQALISKRQ